MRKKNVLVIILTVLVFLSVAALGVSTVYRVDSVKVSANLISTQAESEAADLERRLAESYHKESIFAANEELAQEVLKEYPYFRLLSFGKDYPNRLIITVSEDVERYAVSTGDSEGNYYILNAEGTVLGVRQDTENRSGKVETLIVEGLTATGEKGEKLAGDSVLEYLFPLLDRVSLMLGDALSRNVIGVKVIRPVALSEEETLIKLMMREGVALYVRNPSVATLSKAEKAVNAYLSLAKEQRLVGRVLVWGTEDEVSTHYDGYDDFEW